MNNLQTAEALLAEAIALITKDRPKQHGEPKPTFDTVGAFWTTYLRAVGVVPPENVGVVGRDVVEMLNLLKVVRRAMGDSQNPDNYVDGAGYTALAGMLAGASFKFPKTT